MSAERSHNVMLVDDDPHLHLLFRSMLEEENCQIQEFSEPEPALAVLGVEPQKEGIVLPDVVYTDYDYKLARMNGVGFIRRVRSVHPSLPIILMSASLEVSEIQKALPELNLVCTLAKPFRFRDLLGTLERALLWKPQA